MRISEPARRGGGDLDQGGREIGRGVGRVMGGA